jgi:THO complex subunit 2
MCDEDVTEVSTIFQEILHSVADFRVDAADAGALVKEMVGPESDEIEGSAFAFDPRSLFLDTVSIFMDVETGPYRPQLRDFMVATEISPMLMRQILDPPFLQQMGLIRDTFVKIGIRQSTNLLYRQANYNLLREETEGYSKLTTELFTTSSTEPPTSQTIQATFERVKGLIGTFDLDVGRVLDVTLDVFAAILVKHYRFFIKFLRVSSWWPRSQIRQSSNAYTGGLPPWALPECSDWSTSEEDNAFLAQERLKRDLAFWERARQVHLDAFFELGGRQIADADARRLANGAVAEDPDADAEQQWIKITKTMPPPGNRVAAQLLGFKFRFYTSEARDADDILPANILYLAALLIKVGFISLCDLWPHLWPPEENMEAVRAAKLKELEEKERLNRPGGAANALMTAGALPDDSPAPSTTATRRDATAAKTEAETKAAGDGQEEKAKLPEPDDQKVHLLRCLLTIGAIPESLFILGRYEWLPQAYPDLLALIHRILHHSIDAVCQTSRPIPSGCGGSECPMKPVPDGDQTGVPKGTVKLTQPPPKRPLRWPYTGTNGPTTFLFVRRSTTYSRYAPPL